MWVDNAYLSHAGHVMSSDWKLYIVFQLGVARAIMSRTGWLDVLTARAARCIPNSGHVRNSPTGVCSMFIRRVLICSTKRRIGTLPLSRMSMHVVIQWLCAWSFWKWITSLSLTVDCSPFANENLLDTRYGHPVDAAGKLGQDDQSQSENPWLWYNLNRKSHMLDENQDPRIHTGVLAGHHDHN